MRSDVQRHEVTARINSKSKFGHCCDPSNLTAKSREMMLYVAKNERANAAAPF
jgi:hypothetical protein